MARNSKKEVVPQVQKNPHSLETEVGNPIHNEEVTTTLRRQRIRKKFEPLEEKDHLLNNNLLNTGTKMLFVNQELRQNSIQSYLLSHKEDLNPQLLDSLLTSLKYKEREWLLDAKNLLPNELMVIIGALNNKSSLKTIKLPTVHHDDVIQELANVITHSDNLDSIAVRLGDISDRAFTDLIEALLVNTRTQLFLSCPDRNELLGRLEYIASEIARQHGSNEILLPLLTRIYFKSNDHAQYTNIFNDSSDLRVVLSHDIDDRHATLSNLIEASDEYNAQQAENIAILNRRKQNSPSQNTAATTTRTQQTTIDCKITPFAQRMLRKRSKSFAFEDNNIILPSKSREELLDLIDSSNLFVTNQEFAEKLILIINGDLSECDLYEESIGDTEMNVLAEVLTSNEVMPVRKLTLPDHYKFTDAGFKDLSKIIANNRVKEIKFYIENINNASLCYLTDALQNNTSSRICITFNDETKFVKHHITSFKSAIAEDGQRNIYLGYDHKHHLNGHDYSFTSDRKSFNQPIEYHCLTESLADLTKALSPIERQATR